MRGRRVVVAVMLGALMLLGVWASSGSHAGPAPAGDASAVPVQVAGVAAVGQTQAHAGPDGTSSSASALSVLGKPPGPQFGGSQNGVGRSSGSLLDTGGTLSAGRAQVTPWSASNTDDGTGSHAHAEAALARLALADSTGLPLTLAILQSQSDGTYTTSSSTGASSSDGLALSTGNGALSATVLHSDAGSSGKASSYVAQVNGTPYLTSDQANGQCAQSVPNVVALSCLTASGGNGAFGSDVAAATLGDSTAPGGPLASASVSASDGSGTRAAALAPPPATNTPPAAASVSGAEQTQAAAETQTPSGSLPRTGTNVWFDLMVGIALCALGANLLAARRHLGWCFPLS